MFRSIRITHRFFAVQIIIQDIWDRTVLFHFISDLTVKMIRTFIQWVFVCLFVFPEMVFFSSGEWGNRCTPHYLFLMTAVMTLFEIDYSLMI